MSWNLAGEFIETCSCNMLCPCWFGEADLMLMDQGYCGTSILIRIREGAYEGTNLAGQTAAVSLHFPGPTLFDANATGRIYVDNGASDDQLAALETLLQGRKGGAMEVPASLTSSWLPTLRVPISLSESEGRITASVGDVGTLASRRLVNELGEKVTLQNSAFSMAFQLQGKTGELAPSDGTSWRDPDMPQAWDGRSGVAGQIAWQG